MANQQIILIWEALVLKVQLLALTGLVALMLWRLFRFTFVPRYYPRDPKEYPYWIPFIGHLRSFFKNSYQLLDDARIYFDSTYQPYALTVAGQKWYILTSAEDVNSIYKMKNGSVSYDVFVEEVMGMIGITNEGVRKAYQTQNIDGTSCKHLVHLCQEYQITQLSPGARLNDLVGPAITYIMNYLETIPRQNHQFTTSRNENGITVSLYQCISEMFIELGQEAYFGKRLGEIEPEMTSQFMKFDHLAWQVLYQYPSFLCGKMLKAKTSMHTAFKNYFSVAAEERSDAAWMILELEKDMRRLNLSLHEMSLFFFQLYWRCGNTKKAPFWMLSYLLFNPSLIPLIRHEILPAKSAGQLDMNYLLSSCPYLNALWDETLRCTSFAASVRFLTKDIVLPSSSIVLRKGNRVMMPQRQMHYNEKMFGMNAARFDAERFIANPKMKKSGCYRPFGGGSSLCPGRHFAKLTSFAFIVAFLDKFEIELSGEGQKFPTPTEGNPSIGLIDVEPGTDLQVLLKARF